MPKICVKWGAKKLDVEANTELEPLVLKCQLYELTGVLPERQKILVKGKQLPDDTWGEITLQPGATIMMMGSLESAHQKVEDAPTEQKGKNGSELKELPVVLPAGLRNLGNTCYMNATLQSYKVIPELTEALKAYRMVGNAGVERSKLLTSSVKKLYEDMDKSESKAAIPFLMLQVMHNVFPQFAVQDDHGHYQQQDANECFAETLRMIAEEAPLTAGEAGTATPKASRLFETEFAVELKNMESEEEPVEHTHETQIQLSCYLSQEVKYLQSGLKSKLTEEIEKHSVTLNRNAKYEKKALISRLPAYLSIQMVRFFFKEKNAVNAKILKDVKFPLNLDVLDMCTPELKEKLRPQRDLFKTHDDFVQEQLRLAKQDVDGSKGTAAILAAFEDPKVELESSSFSDDTGSNNSGFYELKAVITHKGRSSNSGHYVAWIRINGRGNKWAMCDDDEVHPVSEEDVLKLSGGGDWHCAYVLLYGPRPLPKVPQVMKE